MKKALIVIDYTNDFVADDGKLTCGKPAQEIEEKLVEITKEFLRNKEYVVMAVDLHYEEDVYHPESKLFPAHNIEGTKGRKLFGKLGELYEEWKDSEFVKWMDKTRYSSFAGTDLEIWLRARGVEEVHLVGVCTDICIIHTGIDAYNRGFKIVVYKDAVASFNDVGHKWAIEHFKGVLGAKVI